MIFPYLVNLLILAGIYVILAVSFNLVLGYAGLLNLSHVALFGIGAYTSALLNINGFPFLLSFFASGIAAGAFGLLLIFATRKLQGDYYALSTLAFAFVVYSLFQNLTGLTRGPLGVVGIPRPNIFGFVMNSNYSYLAFVIFVAAFSVLALSFLVRSPFGRVLAAMRDDEIKVRAMGKDSRSLKYKAAAVSAFFAGIAGSLFAHYLRFIQPSSFYIDGLVMALTIVIIGGIASLRGSVISAVLIPLIPEALRFVSLPTSIIGPARQIIYSLILLAIVILKPRGIFGRIDLE